MKIPVIPDWCKGLPNSTMIFSEDILEYFGCSSSNRRAAQVAARYHVDHGNIPMATHKKHPDQGRSTKNIKPERANALRSIWLLGDLRKLRADMLKESDQTYINEVERLK